ncbi:sensor domain-containing protein [Streptomyces sp. NPDC029003]|uniref:sensor histidine kinase n=1 Tax=Streptomyces sp. NPDC029003 TaxID=3155125 RepID=UPI0033DF3094
MLAPIGREERREAPTGAVGALMRLRAHAAAPPRGAVLALLGLLGLLALVPALIAVGVGATGVLDGIRRLPRLRRSLAGRWSEVPVDDPYLPEPPAPRRRESGMYRDGRQLYASYGSALRQRRVRQMRRDPATRRDLAFLALDPLAGVPVASLPALLVGGGLYAVVSAAVRAFGGGAPPGTAWAGAAVVAVTGLVSVATGLTAGPLVLWVHGCWTRLLLTRRAAGPVVSDGGTLGRRLRLLGAGALLSLMSVAGAVLAAVQLVALVAGLCTGLVVLFLKAVELGQRFVTLYRRLAGDWVGVRIPVPYLAAPEPVRRGADGYYQYGRRLYRAPYLVRQLQLMRHTLTDPAVWRDLVWLVVNPVAAAALLLAPLAVVGFSLFGLVVPGVLDALTGGSGPYTFWDEALRRLPAVRALAGVPWAAAAVGAVLGAAASRVAPYALRLHARFALLLLRPTRHAQLARRVQRLTETRADATGVQAAELRRIERDLHDGAQVSLVAIGMTLRVVERRLGDGAPELRELVAEARRQSSTALAQLRDLVRGIHPPVLAERGVGDAVRAVALDCPLDVEVTVDVPGRPEAPVEACAYFAVCEVLANAAKHSGASRVGIDLRHSDGVLRMTVTDDGRGGADPAGGTGLQGVRRRLGTFDGDLFVSSPVGGPTIVTMELPCVLSSPRTSTS